MQSKTTRAFRTISEAGEELGLQPHVLRFWESKFAEIKPIKRGGGRRFYRPEDIEFLRGIKILLHDEKHPIKDVQKLIRAKGADRIVELGRSVEAAARPKDVKDTVLVPQRILTASTTDTEEEATPVKQETVKLKPAEIEYKDVPDEHDDDDESAEADEENTVDVEQLDEALETLLALKARWQQFKK
ncbi:MAG: MerR family transcriptional regulator [Alphaproteobacteria bacterium]